MGGYHSKPPFHVAEGGIEPEEDAVTEPEEHAVTAHVNTTTTHIPFVPVLDLAPVLDVSAKFVTTLPSVKEQDDDHTDVTCSVCEMPDQPWFMFSCFHVVCFACFERMRTMYGHYLVCPVCRTEFESYTTVESVPLLPFADIDLPPLASFPFVSIQCEREMLVTAYRTMHELGAWESWHALTDPPKHHRVDILPVVETLRSRDPRHASSITLNYVLLQMYFIAKYGYRAYEQHVRVFDVM